MSKIQARKSFIEGCISHSTDLPARTANINVIEPNRFCYYVQKGHDFRENLVSVIVSTLLIFMFVDQLSCYSWMCFLRCTFKLLPKNNVGLSVINR